MRGEGEVGTARPAGTGPAIGLDLLAPHVEALAQAFVSLSSDIALVLDGQGTILRVLQSSAAPMGAAAAAWVGRPWIDTVTGETRRKVEGLLGDLAASGVARRREINHLGGNADGIPVAYTAVRLGEHGPVLAVGRDLRAVAAIQQRFVDSQQELERGYWQARQAEARYRLLFQVANDAVLTVDALSLEIIEANPMAATMLAAAQPLAGQLLTAVFNGPSRGAVQALLTAARSSPRPLEIAARLDDGSGVGVAATPFRTDDTMRLLVRVRSAPETGSSRDVSLARLVDAHDEAIVVTDASGRVRLANPAFLRWVQAGSEAALRGQAITQWIAPEALQRLIDTVQAQGVAEARGVELHQAAAPDRALEMSAVLLTEGDQECIGITLRPRAAAAGALGQDADALPLQLGLAALQDELGRQDLPQLLRRARALAEHSFVEAALQRSGGDAAAAAQLLGVAVARVLRHRRPPATSRDEAPPGAR